MVSRVCGRRESYTGWLDEVQEITDDACEVVLVFRCKFLDGGVSGRRLRDS